LFAGAALAALAIAAFWFAWRQPTYLPPSGDEIDILLELAGVFPDNYKIMWREHQLLRATDPEAQLDPSFLKDALFMHKLTTGSAQEAGDISIEVGYRFYAHDHRLTADQEASACSCAPPGGSSMLCQGSLGFGNYEFSLSVTYSHQQCGTQVDPKRREEFQHAMQTADRLIGFYLQPLRRKPAWL
jgi:hypothetical protein